MSTGAANVLILYDPAATYTNTVQEHLRSFASYSRHHVFFAAATIPGGLVVNLSLFDVVIVHYSVRVGLGVHPQPRYVEALRNFSGLKILFIQDEYDTTETARKAITQLGIHVVFTCVPSDLIGEIYPPARFPGVSFIPTLTGFIPIDLPADVPPTRSRPLLIGYRGRRLPYWYGDLGQEKLEIGRRMKELCLARNLPVDIEWDDSQRIYGGDWYRFLQRSKATLGTESGSNLFDDHGEIRRAVEKALRQKPDATYEELRPTLIAPYQGKARMNQVSPKIFEAIACRTALVLFEGEYSGVVLPNFHFIPLKKDFSNADAVLEKLLDDAYLEKLAEKAYKDVIECGRFSYQEFIRQVDALISDRIGEGTRLQLISVLRGARCEEPAKAGRGRSGRRLRPGIATDIPLRIWEAEEMEFPLLGSGRRFAYFGASSQYSPMQRKVLALPFGIRGLGLFALRSWRVLPKRHREALGPRIEGILRWLKARPRNQPANLAKTERHGSRYPARSEARLRARTGDSSEVAGSQQEIDRRNTEFWNELCGTNLALHLGIRDHSLESLARFDSAYFEFYPYLLPLAGLDRMFGKSVLEIGLGYGSLSRKLAQHCGRYSGLDIAKNPIRMLNHSLRLLGFRGAGIEGSALEIPFESNSFDFVVSIGCIHHTGDMNKCFREIHRVLKPEGTALIMVYNRYSYRRWRRWPLTSFKQVTAEYLLNRRIADESIEVEKGAYDRDDAEAAPETQFISVRELRSSLASAGFSNVDVQKQNCDSIYFGGKERATRKALLPFFGRRLGLDLYVRATRTSVASSGPETKQATPCEPSPHTAQQRVANR